MGAHPGSTRGSQRANTRGEQTARPHRGPLAHTRKESAISEKEVFFAHIQEDLQVQTEVNRYRNRCLVSCDAFALTILEHLYVQNVFRRTTVENGRKVQR